MDPISTAGVAVKDGRYFIARRKPGTSIGESWEFPGGKTEEGETPEEGLKREYQEEFEVGITVKEQLCRGEFFNRGRRYILMAYYIEFTGGTMFLREHQETRWATLSEMKDLQFAESDRIILKALG